MSTSGGERYKIGDVCRIADVQPYVLRYWESEFPLLAPDRSQTGPRTYTSRELKLIERIKRLLYDEGYTIAGAKKRLEGEAGGRPEAKDTRADTNPVVPPLGSSRTEKAEKQEKAERTEVPPKAARAERSEKADKAERPERIERPGRPPRAKNLADSSNFELPAADITMPIVAPQVTSAAQAPRAAKEDERIARAVADLKEILGLLSRPLP
jgi:DNA-binding transcriptional MerR regulator